MSPLGVLIGVAAGAGVWLAVTGVPPARRPRLDDRLAPYLRDAPRPSRLLAAAAPRTPFPTLERLLRPVAADLAGLVERWAGGAASVRRRLDRAGRSGSVEEFRIEQLAWGATGLVAGLALAGLAVTTGGRPQPAGLLVLCAGLAAGGALARDRVLTAQVARREARLLAELPAVAELLALAVAAGEPPAAALARVSRGGGALAGEIRLALHDAQAGGGLVAALDRLAARTGQPALARFVDGIAVALERGTPLAGVLRAQAADARAAGHRALLESAGRREIAMLVPVVFLVLPVTVVFALFPGFYGLRLLAP